MAVAPMKKEEGPPKWDKPLAIIIALVFLAIIVMFVLQYTGPATAFSP